MVEIYDTIIIGSGPAGLAAAVYTTRGAASTLIIGGEKWGGQLMDTTLVDNFPGFPEGILGPDLMLKMRQQAERLGAKFLEKKVTSVDFRVKPFQITVDNQQLKAKSVIIATGASNLWLGVAGEKELIGRGVSICATCDAPFYKEKIVAIVGGGDTAMEEASTLTKFAKKVFLIHRRDQFRASAAMQAKVKENPKIEILWNTEVTEIKGQEKVNNLILKNNKTKKTSELAVDGVFVAIGHQPNSDLFKGQIEIDEKGYIKVISGQTQTSIPGVFVAGDVMDPHYKQAVTAAGSGCAAALDVLQYLSENSGL